MKSYIKLCVITSIFLALLVASADDVDISDNEAVYNHMQGSWVGYSHDGIGEFQFNHYRVDIIGNKFSGWIVGARTSDQPTWDYTSDVQGTWELSEVLTYTNSDSRYRNIYFTEENRSEMLKARTLQNMIVFDKGLYVVGWGEMKKISKGIEMSDDTQSGQLKDQIDAKDNINAQDELVDNLIYDHTGASMDASNLPQDNAVYLWMPQDGVFNEGGGRVDFGGELKKFVKVRIIDSEFHFYTGSSLKDLAEAEYYSVFSSGDININDEGFIYDKSSDELNASFGGASSQYYYTLKRMK